MIAFSHVTAGYGDKAVLDDFSLSLPDTGAVALMGPSGCGKTTLLRVLAGLLKPRAGEMTGLTGRKIAFLFQEDRLLPWLTARKNVAIVSSDEAARVWLERLEIEQTEQFPREMSGGMQRRVALARALAFGGQILLLDEPFKGLDEELRARVADRVRGSAPLIILSIHDRAEAALLGAEIISLEAIRGGCRHE